MPIMQKGPLKMQDREKRNCGTGKCRTWHTNDEFHIYASVSDDSRPQSSSTSTSSTSPATEMCEVYDTHWFYVAVLCGHAGYCSACADMVTGIGNGWPLYYTLRVFSWDWNVLTAAESLSELCAYLCWRIPGVLRVRVGINTFPRNKPDLLITVFRCDTEAI